MARFLRKNYMKELTMLRGINEMQAEKMLRQAEEAAAK